MRNVRLEGRDRVNHSLTTEVSKTVLNAPKAKPSLGVKVRRKHGLIDVRMIYHAKTPKALLASLTGSRDDAKWLPLSQIEYAIIERTIIEVTMPEWLYVENGFDKRRTP